MKKTIYTLLMAMLFTVSLLPAQNLASWALTTDENPTFVADDISAAPLERGNGIASPTFTTNGATTFAWESDDDISIMDYYEFCVTVPDNKNLHITGLSYAEMRNAEGIRSYRIKWSSDNFETYNVINDFLIPDDELTRTESLTDLDIRVCGGETFCLRFYGFKAESYDGEWSISNLNLEGVCNDNCTPPSEQVSDFIITAATGTSMSMEWLPGNGDATMIVGQAGRAITKAPCSGASFVADSSFGLGDDIGSGAFVVYTGTGDELTVTGLTPGLTYFFKAFEYYEADYCYLEKDAPLAAAATICVAAGDAPDISYSALENNTYLRWDVPLCYHEVLVVGSTHPISSVPTSTDGSEYTADPQFGDGYDSGSDFLPTEYPVFKGPANQVAISGLDVNTPYYFRLYVRWGSSWSVGDEVVVSPKQGCPELNGDVVFINEIHYHNIGGELDEGVEVAGPAGVDLSHYTLTFYSINGVVDTDIGDNGNVPLEGIIDSEENGFGAVWFPIADLRYIGGMALWNELSGEVIEFISYRIGSFPAYEGVADGLYTDPIPNPIHETLTSPINFSIQRAGDGSCPGSLVWQGPILASRGAINDGQQSALPITLTYFNGELKGESVLLSWQTALELNNHFMAIEHSMNARDFQEIGRIDGQGNTEETKDYKLWHHHPLPGTNYYRLRQVDYDGTTTFYGLVAINFDGELARLSVYPTVAHDQINVNLQGVDPDRGQLSVVNTYGRIYQATILESGDSQVIRITDLPAGQYYIFWEDDSGHRLTKRFIKY
jgi:hypothetical protein